jgi:signal transduction histidine kinase
MRLILLLCSLICYSMACPVLAGSLADRLAGELAKQAPEQALPLDEVQRLDRRLITPDSLHPGWQRYPLRQLHAIYRYQQECGTDNALPAEWLPLLRALCKDGPMPSTSWFAAHPIYPLGGSSAARWLARYPTAGLDDLRHVRERRDQLGLLGELDDDNLDALLRGDRWLLQSGQLWLLADGQWRRYGTGQWQPLAERLGLMLDSRVDGPCQELVGALCFNERPTLHWQWLALASSLGFILLLGWASWQRWRLLRERRIALQMLTHELRTPIMALSGISEELRHDFDRLPPSAQQSVGQLLGSVARLHQLAQASRHYLAAETLEDERVAVSLAEWLTLACERHGATFCLEREMTLALPFYWLDLALDNLLRNASLHGRAPVRVCASWQAGRLILAISDGGELPNYRLATLLHRGARADGLGLGLAIVRHLLRRLGGHLALSGPPTTFTLTLPCQLWSDPES